MFVASVVVMCNEVRLACTTIIINSLHYEQFLLMRHDEFVGVMHINIRLWIDNFYQIEKQSMLKMAG